jgi:RNA polymerase sigma-70 factor
MKLERDTLAEHEVLGVHHDAHASLPEDAHDPEFSLRSSSPGSNTSTGGRSYGRGAEWRGSGRLGGGHPEAGLGELARDLAALVASGEVPDDGACGPPRTRPRSRRPGARPREGTADRTRRSEPTRSRRGCGRNEDGRPPRRALVGPPPLGYGAPMDVRATALAHGTRGRALARRRRGPRERSRRRHGARDRGPPRPRAGTRPGFVRRLAEVLETPTPEAVAKVHVEDLWLAHAAGQGDAAAIGTIERAHVHGSAAGRLRGQRFSPDEIAEIEQNLREHLFVAKPGERPKIAQYAGRGELSGWIGVSATRAALRARKKTEREVSESGVISRAVADGDVELAFVKEAYRPAFKEAFHEALASLDAKERLLLRQHAVDGLGIDALGELYGVHRGHGGALGGEGARGGARSHADRLRKAHERGARRVREPAPPGAKPARSEPEEGAVKARFVPGARGARLSRDVLSRGGRGRPALGADGHGRQHVPGGKKRPWKPATTPAPAPSSKRASASTRQAAR